MSDEIEIQESGPMMMYGDEVAARVESLGQFIHTLGQIPATKARRETLAKYEADIVAAVARSIETASFRIAEVKTGIQDRTVRELKRG